VHPILFHLGTFPVHSYGVMFALALAVGLGGAVWIGWRDGLPADWLWDVAIALIVGTVVGGRLEYVRTHWSTFAAHPAQILALRDGGVVFYGGFVGALVCILAVIRWRGMPIWRVVDIYGAMVPIGHAVGRIGCFLAGCCYGAPTDLPWGVTYPPGGIPPSDVPRHPTQLYEAAYDLALGAFLLWFRRNRGGEGRTFALLLLLYPGFRALNEVLRGDDIRGRFLGTALTNAQATSILLFALGLVVWRFRTRARSGEPPPLADSALGTGAPPP
jgi:phosphatidylglycerol:prolipoprotein diacylglycerol transferase